MKNIKADIKNNTYKRIYLLYGEEVYLIHSYMSSMKKGILGEDSSDVNFSHFDGNIGFDINEVKEISETLPFFAERRLVIVENSGLFGNDNGFAQFIESIPESTVVIMVEDKVDKNTKLYKEIKRLGYVCEFTTPKPADLVIFAARYLDKENKKISQADCEYLINSVGGDLYNITSELDKVIDYTGERSAIVRSDIDAVCSMQIENKIFDIVGALINHNRKQALKIYFDLIALREQPLGLIRFIMKQYLKLYAIRDGMDRGMNDGDIASEVHSSDWLVKKNRNMLRNYSKAKLLKALTLCTDTEEAIKSGSLEENTGMEILLAKLSSL